MSWSDRRHRPLRRATRRVLFLLTLVSVLALLLSGCATGNPQSTLGPKGPFAQHIMNLFGPVFWAAVAVFVVVEGLLLYSVWRWRARPGDPLPPQMHGNTPLEIGWTIVPAVILLVILGFTFRTQAILATPPSGGINIRVIGHQWWWEFQYPDHGVVTANEMHIPVGVPIRLQLESADVIHSFWIPQLGGKTDLIPGRVNHLWFQADEPGTYSGQCAEFCGIQHALMRVLVFAESPAEFDRWVQQQRSIPAFAPTPTPSPATAAQASLVAQGQQLVTTGACATCHTIRGTQASGQVGPDLTHFASRTTLGANTLANNPQNLRRWVANAQAIKAGIRMPSFTNFSDQELDAIVAYLQSLR